MKRRGAREPVAGSTTVSSASDVVSQVAEPLEQPVIEVMRTVRALLKEGYSLATETDVKFILGRTAREAKMKRNRVAAGHLATARGFLDRICRDEASLEGVRPKMVGKLQECCRQWHELVAASARRDKLRALQMRVRQHSMAQERAEAKAAKKELELARAKHEKDHAYDPRVVVTAESTREQVERAVRGCAREVEEAEQVLRTEVRATEKYLENWERKSKTMFRYQCGLLLVLALITFFTWRYMVYPQTVRSSVPSWFKLHPKLGADLGGFFGETRTLSSTTSDSLAWLRCSHRTACRAQAGERVAQGRCASGSAVLGRAQGAGGGRLRPERAAAKHPAG